MREGESASVKKNAHSKNREGFDMEDLGSVRNTSSNEDDGVKALLSGRAAAQVYTLHAGFHGSRGAELQRSTSSRLPLGASR
jgi:hypothetical protein